MRLVRAILIGAGIRGAETYAPYALRHPDRLAIVGVSDPAPERLHRVAERHGIPPEKRYADWRDALTPETDADAVIVTTQDLDHFAPAALALRLGLAVLLEKPMAAREKECVELVETAERKGTLLMVCHELRYTDFYRKVSGILEQGRVGKVLLINHSVSLSYWEYAHGFVRGPWSESGKSTPMILAKACHDFDLIHWFSRSVPTRVSSFSLPPHLSPAHRQNGIPARCTDGCPVSADCQYESENTYLRAIHPTRELVFSRKRFLRSLVRLSQRHPRLLSALYPPARGRIPYRGWPINALTADLTDEGIGRALRQGPYGRCVFDCTNDQPSCQLTSLEFPDGALATVTMQGHAARDLRRTEISGTRGNLIARFSVAEMEIDVHDQIRGRTEYIRFPFRTEAHGGGDDAIMAAFVDAVAGRAVPMVSPRESLVSHRIAFAADRAAHEGVVVTL